MVTLKSLIIVAPFSEEKRKEILDKLEKNELSDDQKYQFSSLCWDMILQLYQYELQLKVESMLKEIAEGTKNYSKNDFQEEKAKLIYRLSTELNSAESEEALEEVRKKLDPKKDDSSKSP